MKWQVFIARWGFLHIGLPASDLSCTQSTGGSPCRSTSLPAPPRVELIGTTPPVPLSFLVAISLGAVFCGALTYIGNGPNFMVKSIADSSKVNPPTFFGYVFKYSLPILLPILLLTGLLFL